MEIEVSKRRPLRRKGCQEQEMSRRNSRHTDKARSRCYGKDGFVTKVRWGLQNLAPQDPAANTHEPYNLPNMQIYAILISFAVSICIDLIVVYISGPGLPGTSCIQSVNMEECLQKLQLFQPRACVPCVNQSFLVVLEPHLNNSGCIFENVSFHVSHGLFDHQATF